MNYFLMGYLGNYLLDQDHLAEEENFCCSRRVNHYGTPPTCIFSYHWSLQMFVVTMHGESIGWESTLVFLLLNL